MSGYLSLILHAHLPFVRHPEHEKFLEENWLFEAITETYVPLLQLLERWRRDGLKPRLTLTLTPTLCSMLRDPLLQDRYARHLNELIELADYKLDPVQPGTPFIYYGEDGRNRWFETGGNRDYFTIPAGATQTLLESDEQEMRWTCRAWRPFPLTTSSRCDNCAGRAGSSGSR